MTHQHSTSSGGSRASNTKTAVGAAVTILLAAAGGTAYLLTQGQHPPVTPTTHSAPATPDHDQTGTKPTSGTEKPASVPEKSTRPKPPPPDPG
jgi:hypothetical protein